MDDFSRTCDPGAQGNDFSYRSPKKKKDQKNNVRERFPVAGLISRPERFSHAGRAKIVRVLVLRAGAFARGCR